MKLLGRTWNFHVWNLKPLIFMLDFVIRQSLGVLGGRYMICLASLNMSRPCLSTLMLTIWHIRRLCALWFFIFRFFYFMPIWILVDLNKFKTWKWKGKHRSFLVALKWSWILGGFWNFHVWNPKPLLFMLDFIRHSLGLGVDTWFVWF